METNNLKKQQAIEAAYGEYWEQVKEFTTDNGWVKSNKWLGDSGNTLIFSKLKGIEIDCMDNFSSRYCYWFRPKSLQGIETNNGWISILSEEDLPTSNEKIEYTQYYYGGRFLKSGFIILEYRLNYQDVVNHYKTKAITHYHPIIEPKPPIF